MAVSTQIFGLLIGWLMVGWVAAQATALVGRSAREHVRRQRQYTSKHAEFRRRVAATARIARAIKAIPDWVGWRRFRVAAIVDEARDVKSFYLLPLDAQPLPPFLPGQYLTFRLPLSVGEAPLVRCYSLSDRPRQDYYRVTIKRLAALADRTGVPPGLASGFFHRRVRVDDVLEVRAPAGVFFIDPAAAEPIALIGAGIGITPLVSMLEAIVHGGSGREVFALLGFRSGAEHPFKTRLDRLASANPAVHLRVSYSEPRAEDVLHRDYHHRGRLTIDRVREILPSNHLRFYVCGPGGLMESLVPALWEWGAPQPNVHFEAFGPASVKTASQPSRQIHKAYDVRFERSNRSLAWDGSCDSLLEFGEAAGVTMPSGCRAGSCGECLTEIHSGAVATLKQPGFPLPPGHCLTCISVPDADLVLKA